MCAWYTELMCVALTGSHGKFLLYRSQLNLNAIFMACQYEMDKYWLYGCLDEVCFCAQAEHH
jgi:hypothetical protein